MSAVSAPEGSRWQILCDRLLIASYLASGVVNKPFEEVKNEKEKTDDTFSFASYFS